MQPSALPSDTSLKSTALRVARRLRLDRRQLPLLLDLYPCQQQFLDRIQPSCLRLGGETHVQLIRDRQRCAARLRHVDVPAEHRRLGGHLVGSV